LIMMKNVQFSPNLYTTAWHVLRNDLRDLRKWRKCKLFFPSLGWRFWGWVYKNQYQNENQIAYPCGCFDNDETRVILTQPLHHRMPVLHNVSRDLQAWRTSCLDKLADLSAGWLACKKHNQDMQKIYQI
jgi:hypothetical protein